jgi:hypothetical protein
MPHNCRLSPYFQSHSESTTVTDSNGRQKEQEIEVKDDVSRVYLNILIEKVDLLNTKLDKLLEVKTS